MTVIDEYNMHVQWDPSRMQEYSSLCLPVPERGSVPIKSHESKALQVFNRLTHTQSRDVPRIPLEVDVN